VRAGDGAHLTWPTTAAQKLTSYQVLKIDPNRSRFSTQLNVTASLRFEAQIQCRFRVGKSPAKICGLWEVCKKRISADYKLQIS
jgi:hypothetical protein